MHNLNKLILVIVAGMLLLSFVASALADATVSVDKPSCHVGTPVKVTITVPKGESPIYVKKGGLRFLSPLDLPYAYEKDMSIAGGGGYATESCDTDPWVPKTSCESAGTYLLALDYEQDGIPKTAKATFTRASDICVGGIVVSIDKFGLLAPYIGVASTILIATVTTAVYVMRVKRKKEKQ